MSAIIKAVLVCLVAFLGCPVVGAEELKIGYVNVSTVFDNYGRTKASDATLESKGKQKEAELEAKMNELKKLRENLELLNDQARDVKAREIEEKADALKRFRNNTARELRRERDAIAQSILKEIQQAIEEYAKANSYTMIINNSGLLYADKAYELTDQILNILNNRGGKGKP